MRTLLSLLFGAVTLVLVSCQGTDPKAVAMNYSDAVTRLDQVDPAYREFFRSQEGSSYGAAEQHKALVAAVQTARTPVPERAPEVAARSLAQRRHTTAARKGVAASGRKGVASSRGRMAAVKGKGTQTRRSVAKGKSAAPKKKSTGKALAVNTKKRRS